EEDSPIMDELQAQALDELRLGAQLDPSMAREVAQGVRAGQSARGLGHGAADMAQEVMQRGVMAEKMRTARRAFASQIEGQRFSQQQGDREFGLQVAGMNQASAANPYALVLDRQTNPAGAYAG